jgi:hypothetical protein
MTARKKKAEPILEPIIEATAEVVEEKPVIPKEEIAIIKFQNQISRFQADVLRMKEEDSKIIREIYDYLHPVPKPWYTSFGVWLAIILALVLIYVLYVFYMSETGHVIKLPDWLNNPIILK